MLAEGGSLQQTTSSSTDCGEGIEKNLASHIECVLFPKLENVVVANRGNRKGLRRDQGSNMPPLH